MIIRPTESSLLLITQPDHAALSAHIMRHWIRDGLPDSPRREDILLATAEHDNGWREVDATPLVDEATGELLDFIRTPDETKRRVWPRGVERLAATPYAAALVAQHAIHVYARFRATVAWGPFFADMEARRDQHLAAATATFETLSHDYAFVRLGDLISLVFCNAWTEPETDEFGYVIRLMDAQVTVSPDPFEGRPVPIEIAVRQLPNRPFASAADAAAAAHQAPAVALKGVVLGRG